MRRVEVLTHGFEFAHGRAPRGRGSWAFEFLLAGGRWSAPEWAPGDATSSLPTFTAARRWAVERARERGAAVARVCS